MSNTHSAHIIGENFSAFIDGTPDKCDHNSDGEGLLFNDNYQYFKQSECPDDFEGMEKFWRENKIRGGCCSCSKCGKPAFDSFTGFEE